SVVLWGRWRGVLVRPGHGGGSRSGPSRLGRMAGVREARKNRHSAERGTDDRGPKHQHFTLAFEPLAAIGAGSGRTDAIIFTSRKLNQLTSSRRRCLRSAFEPLSTP